mgnify:CR=1 FL=1
MKCKWNYYEDTDKYQVYEDENGGKYHIPINMKDFVYPGICSTFIKKYKIN